MILDGVEFHDSPDSTGASWQGAAALLAAVCLWAQRHNHFTQGETGLSVHEIDAIGTQGTPSSWVVSAIDFVLTDQLFSEGAAAFLRSFVPSGAYYALVRDSTHDQALYGFADDWSALTPLADKIESQFLQFAGKQ